MATKEERKARSVERENEVLAKAEALEQELRKKPRKTKSDEGLLLVSAGVIRGERRIAELKVGLSNILARSDQIGAEEEKIRHSVMDSWKCASPGCEERKPPWILPWAVGIALLLRKGYQISEKKFLDRLVRIPPEGILELSFCNQCKPVVEEELKKLPTAGEHPNNTRLHPRDGAVKYWLEKRVEAIKAQDEQEIARLEREITSTEDRLSRLREERRKLLALKEEREKSEQRREEQISSLFFGLGQATEASSQEPETSLSKADAFEEAKVVARKLLDQGHRFVNVFGLTEVVMVELEKRARRHAHGFVLKACDMVAIERGLKKDEASGGNGNGHPPPACGLGTRKNGKTARKRAKEAHKREKHREPERSQKTEKPATGKKDRPSRQELKAMAAQGTA